MAGLMTPTTETVIDPKTGLPVTQPMTTSDKTAANATPTAPAPTSAPPVASPTPTVAAPAPIPAAQTPAAATQPSAAGAPSVVGPTPAPARVDTEVARITSTDSPLMQSARTSAAQQSAQRGLLNSSLAVQAGEQAVINTALPMAQQNIQTQAAIDLANIEAEYKTVMQTSASASALMTQAQQNISAIMLDKDLSAQAKKDAIAQQRAYLEAQLGVLGGMAGLDLTSMLEFPEPESPPTPSTEVPPSVQPGQLYVDPKTGVIMRAPAAPGSSGRPFGRRTSTTPQPYRPYTPPEPQRITR